MITFLLDINVLLALSDPMHMYHESAHRWFAARGKASWATCPLTENGFVRIASHPNYPNRPGDAPQLVSLLRQLCSSEGHHFWPDEVSIRDILSPDALFTHNHVTDVYLLGLAVIRGGKLATFDRRIVPALVRDGADALEIIPV